MPEKSKGWFLYKNNSISGPYSENDIVAMAEKGELQPDEHIWTEGLKNWIRFADSKPSKKVKKISPKVIPIQKKSTPSIHKKKTPRGAKRVPVVANVVAHDGGSVRFLPCLDLSETGIYLISETLNNYEVGSRLILTLRKSSDIQDPIQITGEVVRKSEKSPKGYALKFINLNDHLRTALKEIVRGKGG